MAKKPRMKKASVSVRSNKPNYSIIQPDEREMFAPVIQAVTSRDTLFAFLDQQAAVSIRETVDQRLKRELLLGCAYDRGMANKYLTGMRAEDIAARLQYSTVHLRACRRLFLRRSFIAEDLRWWQEHQSQFTGFKPKKAEGLGFMLDCSRAKEAFDAESDKRGPGETDKAVIDRIDRRLAPPMVPVTETSPAEQTQRLKIIVHDTTQLLLEHGITDLPYNFNSMKSLEAWIKNVPWSDEIDTATWNEIKDTDQFISRIDPAFFGRDWGESDEDNDEAGNDVADVKDSQGGGGSGPAIPPPQTPRPTPEPMFRGPVPTPTPRPTPAPPTVAAGASLFTFDPIPPEPTPAPTVAAAATAIQVSMSGADTVQAAAPSGALVPMTLGADGVYHQAGPAQQQVANIPSDNDIARMAAEEARRLADDNYTPAVVRSIGAQAMSIAMAFLEDRKPTTMEEVKAIIDNAAATAVREATPRKATRKPAAPRTTAPQKQARRTN